MDWFDDFDKLILRIVRFGIESVFVALVKLYAIRIRFFFRNLDAVCFI